MKQFEKKVLINQLIDSIKSDMMNKVEKMPESWDGFEIRQFLSDHVVLNYSSRITGPRRRAYENDCLTKGL